VLQPSPPAEPSHAADRQLQRHFPVASEQGNRQKDGCSQSPHPPHGQTRPQSQYL